MAGIFLARGARDGAVCGVPHLPFAHLNAAWMQLLGGIEDGDEIWSFTARPGPNAYDKALRQGYVRVRSDEPCDYFLTVRKHVADPN